MCTAENNDWGMDYDAGAKVQAMKKLDVYCKLILQTLVFCFPYDIVRRFN